MVRDREGEIRLDQVMYEESGKDSLARTTHYLRLERSKTPKEPTFSRIQCSTVASHTK